MLDSSRKRGGHPPKRLGFQGPVALHVLTTTLDQDTGISCGHSGVLGKR